MTDLAHTYDGDITAEETLVDAADTQSLAQKKGKNTNYLLDQAPILAAELAAITPVKFQSFSTGVFSASPGDNAIFTAAAAITGALVFITPATVAPAISASGSGLGRTVVFGPEIPIVILPGGIALNWLYNSAPNHSDFKFYFSGSTLILNTSNGGSFNVTGVVMHA